MKKTDLTTALGILAVSSAMFLGGCSEVETGVSGSAPEALSKNTSGATIIKGDFSEQRTFEGDVVIKGDVLPGATLKVVNGGLKVEGNIGDEARITQTDRSGSSVVISSSVSVTTSTGNMTITRSSTSSRVTVDGQEVTPSTAAGILFGTEIGGSIGNQATVESTSSITTGFLKYGAKLEAGNQATFSGSEGNCKVHAGNSITTKGNIGDGCVIEAGNSVTARDIGARAVVTAGNSVTAADVGEVATVNAGNSATVGRIGKVAEINAGNSIKATCTYPGTKLDAGNRVSAPACP